MSGPVTISITRHVAVEHEPQMAAWVRAGTELAARFDGFLGTGWVRPSSSSDEWHMLYRFADEDSLQAWEGSSQRRWWLDSAQGLVGESVKESRTGIEGWFDQPVQHDVEDLRPVEAVPPRWKQMCAIFVVFAPVSVAANYLGREILPDGMWLWARVLVTISVMTPLMVYVGLPWITGLLKPWLTGTPRR